MWAIGTSTSCGDRAGSRGGRPSRGTPLPPAMPAMLPRSAANVSDAPLGVPVVPEVNMTTASSGGAALLYSVCSVAMSSRSAPTGVSTLAAPVASVLRVTSGAGTIVLAAITEHPAAHAAWIATTDAALFPRRTTTRSGLQLTREVTRRLGQLAERVFGVTGNECGARRPTRAEPIQDVADAVSRRNGRDRHASLLRPNQSPARLRRYEVLSPTCIPKEGGIPKGLFSLIRPVGIAPTASEEIVWVTTPTRSITVTQAKTPVDEQKSADERFAQATASEIDGADIEKDRAARHGELATGRAHG